MKTLISTTGDTIVIQFDGKLNFETQLPLKDDLFSLLKGTPAESIPKKIIFNLENLEFVGSSGISTFIQILRDFNANSPTKPKYCFVKNEFKKMISAFDQDGLFEFYDNEENARQSFDQ